MMQKKITFRFQAPKLAIIAEIVYPMQNPLYDVITYISGIPIIVEPASHIIPTNFKFSIIEILVSLDLSTSYCSSFIVSINPFI